MNAERNAWISGGAPFALQAAWPLVALIVIFVLTRVAPDTVVEVSGADVVIVTFVLGGGAAWLSGRAIAETWRPYRQLLLAMVMLAAAVRFIHFALFEGTLLSLNFYLIDLVVLSAFASLGYRTMRVRQMRTQYGWLYQGDGPLGWKRKPVGPP